MPTLESIKQKAIGSDLSGALLMLLDWVKANRNQYLPDVELLISNLNKHEKERADGTLTTEQYTSAYTKVNKGFYALIRELKGESGSNSGRFQSYHSFTCDRSKQMKDFDINLRKRQTHHKHFFYLYGLEMQSHEGIFKRIAYHLDGLLYDYINPSSGQKIKTEKIEVSSIDWDNDFEAYQRNVLRKLFRAFGLEPNLESSLIDKKLSYLLQKSPEAQGLGAQDYICVFMNIHESDWDAELTPEMVRWFINEFCSCDLPQDCPELLFFFGIVYYEDNEKVANEVKALVKVSELVIPLPELGMVTAADFKNWFIEYKKYFPRTRDRKNLIKQHLKNLEDYKEEEGYFMEDIEVELSKIIDKINKELVKNKQ